VHKDLQERKDLKETKEIKAILETKVNAEALIIPLVLIRLMQTPVQV
jgi:hypothetical protein